MNEEYMQTGIKEIVIHEIIELAQKNKIQKVLLFGSRARGDFHRASDIDLAVKGKNVTEFTLAVKEETSTLLDFDVIDLDSDLHDKFRQSILKEGMVIYEEI